LKMSDEKQLTLSTINPHVRSARYAVRGELLIKAEELQSRLKSGDKLPFDEIVFCNIGNPQQLRQKPITFFRQVLALLENPELLSHPQVGTFYPSDAIEKARRYSSTFTSTGAYSHSQGLPVVRELVAKFIQERDGYPSDPDNLFLTDGASPAVQNALKMLIRNENDGIMIPIPQYPLYSATIALLNGQQVGYYLDESQDWGSSVQELERSYEEAKSRGVEPRALVIINPGNPTGQVLEEKNMREVVDFVKRRKLVLLADEVYQENVYYKEKKPFHSFKKVLCSMGDAYSKVELFSFHSTSKGFLGECGKRGGYMELHNIDPEVQAEFYKLASINLCPNVLGQLMVGNMVSPPKEGDPSWDLYKRERDTIYDSLKKRAQKLTSTLNKLEGFSCNEAEGAMYAFPQIRLSNKAVQAAKKDNKLPDAFYSFKLLEATGICVVPGSGFGQKEGTWHFRTTFLPPEDKIDLVIERLSKFHKDFVAQYKD